MSHYQTADITFAITQLRINVMRDAIPLTHSAIKTTSW